MIELIELIELNWIELIEMIEGVPRSLKAPLTEGPVDIYTPFNTLPGVETSVLEVALLFFF